MAEDFKYKEVLSKKEELDGYFKEFAELFGEANTLMNNHIALNENSGLLGTRGNKFLQLWNDNIATFSDFYDNFDNWSKVMVIVSQNFDDLETKFETYKTTGKDLKIVENGRLEGLLASKKPTDQTIDEYTAPSQIVSDAAKTVVDATQTAQIPDQKTIVVADGTFLETTTYAQFSSLNGVGRVYLDDGMTIYYEDGKIMYPDGHYEERNLRNMYDFEAAWKEANGYMYESEVPVTVPSGYTLIKDTDYLSSLTYTHYQNGGGIGSPVYLNDDMTIYYQDGKIYYPDGTYKERNLKNMYDFEAAWKEVNNYVYKSDCK